MGSGLTIGHSPFPNLQFAHVLFSQLCLQLIQMTHVGELFGFESLKTRVRARSPNCCVLAAVPCSVTHQDFMQADLSRRKLSAYENYPRILFDWNENDPPWTLVEYLSRVPVQAFKSKKNTDCDAAKDHNLSRNAL